MSERLAEVQEMSKGMTLRQLRSLIDDDVVRRHDILMDLEIGLGELGPEDYRAELDRRVPARQTTWVIRLTWAIAVLTLAIVILEYLPRISGAGH